MTLRIVVLSCVLCFLSTQTHAQQEFFPFLAEVTGANVNVRAGQSRNFEKLSRLKKGDKVVVIDKSYSWYKIQLPLTANSFVSDKYILLEGRYAGMITADRVNIRAGSGINYSIIGQLSQGAKVKVLETTDGWVKIEPVPESYGWIKEDFLTFKSKDITHSQMSVTDMKKEAISLELDPVDELLPKDISKSQMVSAVGYLTPYEHRTDDEIYYRLKSNGKLTYFLKGLRYALDEFRGFKVQIEGIVQSSQAQDEESLVVEVSKIELIL